MSDIDPFDIAALTELLAKGEPMSDEKITAEQAVERIQKLVLAYWGKERKAAVGDIIRRVASCDKCMDSGQVLSSIHPITTSQGEHVVRYITCDKCELGKAKAEVERLMARATANAEKWDNLLGAAKATLDLLEGFGLGRRSEQPTLATAIARCEDVSMLSGRGLPSLTIRCRKG